MATMASVPGTVGKAGTAPSVEAKYEVPDLIRLLPWSLVFIRSASWHYARGMWIHRYLVPRRAAGTAKPPCLKKSPQRFSGLLLMMPDP